MISLILHTVRIFIAGGWDDSPGWFDYLFRVSRMLQIHPDELIKVAITYPRDDQKAKDALWRLQMANL